MAGISISGLVSGSFDWKSVVDQLITIEKAPIARMQTEQAVNNEKLAALSTLSGGLSDLSSAAIDLRSSTLFQSRTATSGTPGSSWSLSASTGAVTGTQTIAVSQLATASRRLGATGVSAGLSATNDVSGTTVATLPTAKAVTAGDFTVNGKTISVALTDSLQDVFDQIAAKTGGAVTASYDSVADKVTFSSAGEIELGAVNDSSNFLSALQLSNNGTGAVTSRGKLGSAVLTTPLASSRLAGALTPDGDGNGSFSINGVAIGYNVNSDTLNSVLARINSSSAGVTASYDSVNDRFVLANKSTGDTGIGANEVSGGLLDAMGLTSGTTLQRGKNAIFTLNDGDPIVSASNTLTAAEHGITGLSITVDSATTQTVTVGADTTKMKAALTAFMDAFNAVQGYIDEQTAVTVGANGKVTKATLGGNLEVEAWGSKLRSMASATIGGLSTNMSRLEDIGIGFSSVESQLSIKDPVKLEAMLAGSADDIGNFFSNIGSGFSQQFTSYVTSLQSSNGALKTQSNNLGKQNTGLDEQIATLTARIENQRELLTASFLAMQNAQSIAQQQQQQLTNMFAKKTEN